MKKICLTIAIMAIILLTGCSNQNEAKIKQDFIRNVENLKSYYMEGEMKLINNDDTYKYDVKVSYKKDNNYKVELTNKANNYQQIILKNNDGVYVISPSINKSFKFQSTWPDNNSQVYLLQSIVKDLKNDQEAAFEQENSDYVFTTKVNYPNNPSYVKQKIILDKNNNLKEVEVLDEQGVPHVEFYVTDIDKKPSFSEDYFNLEKITKQYQITQEDNEQSNNNTQNNKEEQNQSNKEQTTASLEDSLFPFYLPTNTALSNKETIKTENGERLIMTFSGDNPFILVQETVSKEEELTIVPTYGEPFLLIDTVGSLTDISYTWTSNGIEYYIASDTMSKQELLEVAKSLNVVATINEK